MAREKTVEMIDPSTAIRSKVSGGGPISPEMLRRADAAMKKLSASFTDVALGDINELDALCAQCDSDPEQRPEVMRRIFQISHDLRGQGATLGFPLVTRIGISLCAVVEGSKDADPRVREVIRLHIDALRAVVTRRITGDGGDIGRAIATGLETAAQRVLS